MKKYVSTKNLILSALTAVLLCCAILGYSLFGNKKADALDYVPTTTTIGAIYNFNDNCYDAENLNALSARILGLMGHSGTTFDDLISYARNTAGENGLPIKASSTTLQYGRYRFSDKSSWKNLAWMPVYLSRSTSGDAVLTLYLAATEDSNRSTSQQEAGNFAHDGNYSTHLENEVPTNMYSTSFIRAVSLGNLGKYADYQTPGNSTAYNKLYDARLDKSNYNKFSDFVKGSDFTGDLYPDIVTPAQMKWQANESYAAYIGTTGSGDRYEGKIFPNEAYGSPSAGDYTNAYFNYASGTYMKSNYDAWKNDKVWLPSLTEVGTGNISDGVDTTNGIWKLTATQRSNTTSSWLRTADTNGPSASNMFVMDRTGNVATSTVDKDYGIRPAIHLNLSAIVRGNRTVAPINIPDVVTSPYTGDYQKLDEMPEDKRKELFPWYSSADMYVTFAYDYDFSRGTVPLNAGEYYMRVELKSSSDRFFLGSTLKGEVRKFKFIVEKAKIGVKWVYEDTSQFSPPAEIQLIGDFHERDIKANNIPSVGMVYSNTTGAGIQNSPTWPEEIGWYKAVACIIDDDIHNYNYELASEIEVVVDGEKVKTDKLESHQFEVLQLPVGIPYFKDYPDRNTVTISYKGKQYIQLANVSKYVEVTVTANPQSAQNKIVDLGVVDGVQTFALESVASYEFTFTLKDTLNTVWQDDGINNSYQNLTLNIDKAELTLEFEGLPGSWETARAVEFSVNVLGIYSTGSQSNVVIGVRWQDSAYNNGLVEYDSVKGKFVIPANTLSKGDYSMQAYVSNIDSLDNYALDGFITQKFSVKETNIDFTTEWVKWNYKVDGDAHNEGYAYNTYNSEAKALQLDFVEGGYYEFYLGMSAGALKDHFLKAEYSGDTYVNAAGMHSVTVTISAYYKNIDFEPRSFTIYFNIQSAKFDISGVEWDYTSPFTYSGSEYKVRIKPETLPEGLTVVYSTGGIATNAAANAGSYTTSAIFIVSEDYSANYLTPSLSDANSYINNGGFSFTCNWNISKKDIAADWITEDATSNLFFVPYLSEGHTLVNYTYEHSVGGSWTSCTGITSTSTDELYRVTAAIKSEYASNYNLTGTTSKEFTVQAGKYAVSTHIEVNNKKADDGAQIPYTGSAFDVKPVSDSADLAITSSDVKYYTQDASGNKGTLLSSAPKAAGKYVAVITATFAGGFQSETEFKFEITKNDIDLSPLRLVYEHGDVTISARWNNDLHKWVDASGKEVSLSFEYDGTTHELKLEGYENIAGLSIDDVQDKSATNAGKRTMHIDYSVDSNYNEPELATTVNWEIRKASVNFEGVKWGYIDADGNEYEFGADGSEFTFARDEDKNSVQYRVGLINLPSYLADYFRYTTTSYTDAKFGSPVTRNFASGSAVGEYHTEVEFSGMYTGDNNHASFSSSDIPQNIPLFLDWEIIDRDLTSPEYDGSWILFDNKIHNLIEMCGIPEDELNYFDIEITYLAYNNGLINNYPGFDAGEGVVPYTARDAGLYTVTFYKLVIEYDESGKLNDKARYVWGQVEVEAGKAELEVTWDRNGSIPVAKVKGIYVSDMIDTVYYIVKDGERGAEASLEYIKSTDGSVTFEAEPRLTEKYANNLTYVMGNGEVPVCTFTYEPFRYDDKTTEKLSYPEIVNAKVEYTGSAITFSISNWSNLQKYLYIVEGAEALTKTDVGVYHVTVGFIKGANACWRGADEDNYRASYVLEFEITPVQKVGLDAPTFDKLSATYTGDWITFSITNWLYIQDYVDYTVTYKGAPYTGSGLRFKEAGIYTLTFTFKDVTPVGYWVDDPTKKELIIQLKIVDAEKGDTEIFDPVFKNSSKPYTGEELTFEIDNWSYFSQYVVVESVTDGATYTGGVFKATEQKEYTVVFRITAAGYTFSDGRMTATVKFTVAHSEDPDVTNKYAPPEVVSSGNSGVYSITNWSSYGGNVEVTFDNDNVSVSADGVITATKPGVYTVTFTIKGGVNAVWNSSKEGEETTITRTFTVVEEGKPVPVSDPVMVIAAHEYTGYEITFEIANWSVLKEYLAIAEGSLTQTAVGEYKITLQLKDPNKALWAIGDEMGTREVTFSIIPATITFETDEEGNPVTDENGKPIAKNGEGKEVKLDDYLEPKYYDPETGEEVPADALVDGKTYDVKYNIKNEEEFNKNIANSSDVKQFFSENTYNYTYTAPAEDEDKMLMIITLVEVGILVVLVIATIVVLAAKRREYVDDYADNYDDDDD